MKPRVVITQRVHDQIVSLLEAEAEVIVNQDVEPWARETLLAHARTADGLMVFMPDRIDDQFLAHCPKLRIVAAALKGYDNFDTEALSRRGIRFTIVPDLLSEPTAELALALVVALARNVKRGDDLIRTGAYAGWRPILYGRTLAGATVGLIGYGAVARAFERLIAGFNCHLIWHDKNLGGTDLNELLAQSDFVLPLLPLTSDTLHLINRESLSRMKPGAYLVNVGRGSVVDEKAVADALESGHLAGYAADVFEIEDWARADRPRSISSCLLAMPDRTVFTPHLGSATRSARLEIERTAAQEILKVINGPAASA